MTPEPTRDVAADGVSAPDSVPSIQPSAAAFRPLEDSIGREEFLRRLVEQVRSPLGGNASRAWIFRAGAGGGLLLTHEAPPPLVRGVAGTELRVDPLAAGGAIAEAWRSRRAAWRAAPAPAGPWIGACALGAVPFRIDLGSDLVLVAAWDDEEPAAESPFLELARVARDAGRRLELAEAARQAEEERAALAEWMRAGAAAHHVSEALRAAGRAALCVTGAEAAAVWTGQTEPLQLVHTAGELREREALARQLAPRAARVAARGQAEIAGADDAPLAAAGIARLVLVPIAAYGRALGALAVYDGAAPAEEPPSVRGVDTLIAIADGLAMVLDRAERTEAVRRGEQQVHDLRARLRRRDRLASAGERAAGALGEARHPLASIGAFARRAHREMAEDDPRREYVEVILRESERLERLLSESTESALPEPARFRLQSLNAVLADVLPAVGEKLVRRRVRLLKRLDPESPRLLLDVDRIRQVFRNVIDRAVESVPIGGRVRVESRLIRDHVIAEIAFDGAHTPGDLIEELFVPFAPAQGAAGVTAAATGLGVADQIIRQHGGEIRVRADGEWGASVLITLPVRGNEERRTSTGDRRLTRSDRRQPAGTE